MSIWDIVQQVQISNLQSRATLSDTQSDIRHSVSRDRDEDLREDMERMALVIEAMWSILSERLGVTVDELAARINAIDLADGRADGMRTPAPRTCPQCAAKVPADRETCQFCGAVTPGASTFDL